ncbi:MAG: family hydrolase [Alphaproteobacteria bacterium]|nr:family hydrolase [Alphaproteobacteria bacterium]
MKYIFFDVDGVLINGFSARSDHYRRRWDENLERDLGIVPQDMQNAFFERGFKDVILGKRDLLKALDDVLPEMHYRGMAQTLVDYWLKHDSEINTETMEIVKKLKARPGMRLFLATHQEKYRANHLWHELGFKEYFEEIYYSGRMGMSKTEHRFFDLIENELCLTERDCLLIDDDPKVIEAATKAGWHTILFNGPEDIAHLVEAA